MNKVVFCCCLRETGVPASGKENYFLSDFAGDYILACKKVVDLAALPRLMYIVYDDSPWGEVVHKSD